MLRKAIFDMDGLIFDSERLFMNCLKVEMAKHGYLLTEAIYVNTLGLAKSDCEIYMKSVYGQDYPFEEISTIARNKMVSIARTELPVKEGIRELLQHFTNHNVECVVASSTETKYIHIYMENAGLLQYFSKLIGGETVIRSKPEPDIFLKALGNTEKENAVILEDSENGIIAASRAEIRAICIPDMKYPSADILAKTFARVGNAFDVIKMEELL